MIPLMILYLVQGADSSIMLNLCREGKTSSGFVKALRRLQIQRTSFHAAQVLLPIRLPLCH